MAMADSDLALAMAIAENSCSSQDDDFQLSSHAGQLFILNKLAFSQPSKRQKTDRLSSKKASSQKPEHASKSGKENQNPSRLRDGSKGCSTNADLSKVRRPLQARKRNVASVASSELATKKECRKQENEDEAQVVSSIKLPDKKQKFTGNVTSRFSTNSPEKPFKQASVSLTRSHFLTVDDACVSLSGPSAHGLGRQEDESLIDSHSLAANDDHISPSRPSSHEHHLKYADEIINASPCFAMHDACITSSKPSSHECPCKQAHVILKSSHSLAGDDIYVSSSRFSACEHQSEHACETLTDSHSLAQHDAQISALRHSSKKHHCKQENIVLTGSQSACLGPLMPSLHEHCKQADETHITSPKLRTDEDSFEPLRKTQCFLKVDAVHQSLKAHDLQQEEAAQTNRFSPMHSQISVPKPLLCDDGNLLLDNTACCDATFSSLKLMEETVSLAEEDDLVIDVVEQERQPFEPECYPSGKLLSDDCLPSASVNPESQFNALLQLCVDAVDDNDEETETKEDTLSDHVNLKEACSKVEEVITSLLTQTRFKNPVDSSNSCLLHKEEKLTTSKVFLKNDEGNATTFCKSSPEAQELSYQAQNKPFIFECEGADTGATMYNAGTQLWTEPALHQHKLALECPVCGSCITDLSLEQREVHTNACLDSMDTAEAHADREFADIDKDQVTKGELGECVQENYPLDLTPVLKWLETLNLSRYASIFVREEIDWDTLKCLTDEDLSTLGITALGPRRKILHAIKQLEKRMGENSSNTVHQEVGSNQHVESDALGRKLITDFFELPPSLQRKCIPRNTVTEPSNKEKRGGPGVLAARKRILTELGGVPEWMSIPGTKFRVDAFQHLRADCSHWFLTHFHTDHYQGLTRGFRYGLVYCSPITAQLVNTRIGVPSERLKALPLNERIDIDGVKVTFIDANHCPGSVMILFEPPNGKAVLHTGDFRFCEAMANSCVLQACNIHTLVLDTTYCNPQYDFPKQEVAIQFIIDAIQAEAFNPTTLFLIGTYTIGKERIFFEVAKVLQKKIYCCATKLRLLQCMNFPDEDMKWLTTNDMDSHIHVVPLWSIASFKRMSYISRRNHGRYNSIVSFSPTGWSYGRGKKRTPGRRWQQGTIVRYEVPYSEHCSFKELREFVRFINPVDIVPSVNNNSSEAADALIALLLSEEEN